MEQRTNPLDVIDQVLTEARSRKIFHLYTEDEAFNGREVRLDGRSHINFASCSYLGLEKDERLIAGAIDATRKYGTQFASSRAYISSGLYKKIEDTFDEIFAAHTLVAPSTTLAHLSAIPTLVEPGDVIIQDHQVHMSVQTACKLVKARGDVVDVIRHSRMDMLEKKIDQYRNTHRRIWYCLDGVYSMYGDLAPFDELTDLLSRYEQLNLYIDDAHGFSWSGRKGCGIARTRMASNPRIVVAGSLCKSFGAGGGLLVFADPEQRRRVRTCGGTFIFSGPIQPPVLGALLASAQIHASGAVEPLQLALADKIEFTRELLKKYELPDVTRSISPIFFVGVGSLKVGFNLTRRLIDDGFLVNIGLFPGVPIRNTGIRFTNTLHMTNADLSALVEAMARHFPRVLEEEGVTLSSIYKVFNFRGSALEHAEDAKPAKADSLRMQRYDTIRDVPAGIWHATLGPRGTFDVAGLGMLERVFTTASDPGSEWSFHYRIIVDEHDTPVLAAFLTDSLIKTDMFADRAASRRAEEERKLSADAFTVKCLMLGSGLTEGEHLYLDREHRQWRQALRMFLAEVQQIQAARACSMVCLRDFHDDDEELDRLMLNDGFFKARIPYTHQITLSGQREEEFFASLKPAHRRFLRKEVRPFDDRFEIILQRNASTRQIEEWYALYRQVKDRGFEINTFPLPISVITEMVKMPEWEVLELRLKPEFSGGTASRLAAVCFCYRNASLYCLMLIGIDYALREHGAYRQALYRTVQRALSLGMDRMRSALVRRSRSAVSAHGR